jgi:hypothetical protein
MLSLFKDTTLMMVLFNSHQIATEEQDQRIACYSHTNTSAKIEHD